MPMHEYHCQDCGQQFELHRGMKDQGLAVASCPRCHQQARKLYLPGTMPKLNPDYEPHFSEQLGVHIGSRRAEKEHIRRTWEESQGTIRWEAV